MFENTDNKLTTLAKGAFLVTGKDDANVMTIGWGFIGYMWKKPVFIAPVRTSRYSHELLEKYGTFTVSFPEEGTMKSELGFAGTKSGRDIDKFEALGLKKIPAPKADSYFVDGCSSYYECRIIAKTDLTHDMLGDEADKFYADDNMHTLYFAEIL